MATCYRHLMKNLVSLINMGLFYCILYQFYTTSVDIIIIISEANVISADVISADVISDDFIAILVAKFFKLVHFINFSCVWLVLSHLLVDRLGCKCLMGANV
jgi:hypothetical protein